MNKEHLDEEREAHVADVEETRGHEEQRHQQQSLDQVGNYYTVYLSFSHDAFMGLSWGTLHLFI